MASYNDVMFIVKLKDLQNMSARRSMLLAVGLVAASIFPGHAEAAGCTLVDRVTGNVFSVFDGTLYKNKPNFSQYCINRVDLEYKKELWPKDNPDFDALPPRSIVEDNGISANNSGLPAILDIEQWSTTAEFADNETKYLTIYDWFKGKAPDIPVGYYRVAPRRNYSAALAGPGSSKYKNWQADNDRRAELARRVDVLYPSLYTLFDDVEGWKIYAKANIEEARRIAPGKPVIVFIWPQFHVSNDTLRYKFIDGAFWRVQLEFLREHADGIVIWGGWSGSPLDWDESAPWWQETLDFLSSGFTQVSEGDPLPPPDPTPIPDPNDSSPPSVTILNPTNGSEVAMGSTIESTVSASDETELTTVDVYVDGSKAVTFAGEGVFKFNWKTSQNSGVKHVIMAKAVDGAGNSSSSEVAVTTAVADPNPTPPDGSDVEPPTVQILEPSNGAKVRSKKVTITFEASDAQELYKVALFIDGEHLRTFRDGDPYVYEWKPTRGRYGNNHIIKVVATDIAKNKATSKVTVKTR
jgi:hypothetical protein